MRAFWLAGVFVTSLAAADDSGVTPRQKPTDYPAHDSAKTAVLAAAVIPPDQVKKIFSAEVAKGYIVVELAIYPEGNRTFDVDRFDFSLQTGDQMLHAANPQGILKPWQDKPANARIPSRGPNVGVDTGIGVAHGPDPVTGRPTTSVSTYESVHVSNYPQDAPPPPPRSDPDPSAVAQIVRNMALPEGATAKTVAGFLYFRYSGKKRPALTLNYANDDLSVDLKLPK